MTRARAIIALALGLVLLAPPFSVAAAEPAVVLVARVAGAQALLLPGPDQSPVPLAGGMGLRTGMLVQAGRDTLVELLGRDEQGRWQRWTVGPEMEWSVQARPPLPPSVLRLGRLMVDGGITRAPPPRALALPARTRVVAFPLWLDASVLGENGRAATATLLYEGRIVAAATAQAGRLALGDPGATPGRYAWRLALPDGRVLGGAVELLAPARLAAMQDAMTAATAAGGDELLGLAIAEIDAGLLRDAAIRLGTALAGPAAGDPLLEGLYRGLLAEIGEARPVAGP